LHSSCDLIHIAERIWGFFPIEAYAHFVHTTKSRTGCP
jgi:hypothetical protein